MRNRERKSNWILISAKALVARTAAVDSTKIKRVRDVPWTCPSPTLPLSIFCIPGCRTDAAIANISLPRAPRRFIPPRTARGD